MSAPEDRVSCRYGAPMGRGADDLLAGKVSVRRVRLDYAGYDSGGAYWGIGLPLYYAEGSEGGYVYLRALTRNAAKRDLVSGGHFSPSARFYR